MLPEMPTGWSVSPWESYLGRKHHQVQRESSWRFMKARWTSCQETYMVCVGVYFIKHASVQWKNHKPKPRAERGVYQGVSACSMKEIAVSVYTVSQCWPDQDAWSIVEHGSGQPETIHWFTNVNGLHLVIIGMEKLPLLEYLAWAGLCPLWRWGTFLTFPPLPGNQPRRKELIHPPWAYIGEESWETPLY